MEKDILSIPQVKSIQVGKITLNPDKLFLIAGPCVIESRELILDIAGKVFSITQKFSIPYIFKASYDKANRTSLDSFRGPGLEQGIEDLRVVRDQIGIPVLTDIHEVHHAEIASRVADILQIPAFLCRQTDLLIAAGKTGKAVNIKKGQFVDPRQMSYSVGKIKSTGNENIILTERGASFGYGNLVVDMRSIPIMRENGFPVVFDATHSVQLPSAKDGVSGGQREFIFTLAKAAVAAGASGLFIETHPDPEKAKSDGSNMLPLNRLEEFLEGVLTVFNAINRKR